MTGDEIYSLLAPRLQAVLALDGPPARQARLSEDLRADSLDLLEVVEAVEADLAARGIVIQLPAEALQRVRTVDDAVEAVMENLPGGAR